MQEPYYTITKVTDSAKTSSSGAISERELIRRLNIICDEMHSPSRSIEILVNGVKEKRE